MLSKRFESIDRFYMWLAGTLILLAILVGFVARGILTSISLSRQIESGAASAPVPRLLLDEIDKALGTIEPGEPVGLDL